MHSRVSKPHVRPKSACFSSGPCAKHPGWNLSTLRTDQIGRSHRSSLAKKRISQVIERSAQLLGLPTDWKLAIVPASDTGAFEMALWSLIGARGVDVFAWESFSQDWADDITQHLGCRDVKVYSADYGELPVMKTDPGRDTVFVFNGTTSGVRVANLDWIATHREGLVFCDATSAVFAMEIDYSKLDIVTWSWQKALGGEAGFGMMALSPQAVERAQTYQPDWPLPKIFRMSANGKLNAALFAGSTINTPSMIAIEDIHSALDWADAIGGLPTLIARNRENHAIIDRWVSSTPWVDWLVVEPQIRSSTSMCLQIVADDFRRMEAARQQQAIKTITGWLEQEQVAYDIGAYRSAPAGFRIWGGATVEATDLQSLVHWLDWAFARWSQNQLKETP